MLFKKRRRLPIDRYYFLRRIDELGRIVIPIEIRKELKIEKGVTSIRGGGEYRDSYDGVDERTSDATDEAEVLR